INFPQLTPGDEIDIQTRYGNFRYRITGSRVVSPDDMTVLVPSAPGYQLTLTTCWPLWAGAFATQRYVIFADQFWPAPYKRGYTWRRIGGRVYPGRDFVSITPCVVRSRLLVSPIDIPEGEQPGAKRPAMRGNHSGSLS